MNLNDRRLDSSSDTFIRAVFRLVEQSNSETRFEVELPLSQGQTSSNCQNEPGLSSEVSCGCEDMEDVSHPLLVVSEWQK